MHQLSFFNRITSKGVWTAFGLTPHSGLLKCLVHYLSSLLGFLSMLMLVCVFKERWVFLFEKKYFVAWLMGNNMKIFSGQLLISIFLETLNQDSVMLQEALREREQFSNEQNISLGSSGVLVPIAMRAPCVIPALSSGGKSILEMNSIKLMNSSDSALELWKACVGLHCQGGCQWQKNAFNSSSWSKILHGQDLQQNWVRLCFWGAFPAFFFFLNLLVWGC